MPQEPALPLNVTQRLPAMALTAWGHASMSTCCQALLVPLRWHQGAAGMVSSKLSSDSQAQPHTLQCSPASEGWQRQLQAWSAACRGHGMHALVAAGLPACHLLFTGGDAQVLSTLPPMLLAEAHAVQERRGYRQPRGHPPAVSIRRSSAFDP